MAMLGTVSSSNPARTANSCAVCSTVSTLSMEEPSVSDMRLVVESGNQVPLADTGRLAAVGFTAIDGSLLVDASNVKGWRVWRGRWVSRWVTVRLQMCFKAVGGMAGWDRMRRRGFALRNRGDLRTMTKHATRSTSVSALMGVAVADASGQTLGHVREFAVSPPVDANHVQGLVLKLAGAGRAAGRALAAVGDLELTAAGGLRMRGQASPKPMPEEDSYLLLERDLLDQQIIDVHGHKVVRVNDVDLVWEAVGDGGVEGAPCAAAGVVGGLHAVAAHRRGGGGDAGRGAAGC